MPRASPAPATAVSREVAILKTVGATRSRIAGVFSVEFLILGLAAGLIGSLLAAAFTAFVVDQLMDGTYVFDWLPIVAAIAMTALLAIVTGWAASYRILGQNLWKSCAAPKPELERSGKRRGLTAKARRRKKRGLKQEQVLCVFAPLR